MFCAWCSRKLGKDHGYSEEGLPICASYSATQNKIYNACKSRKSRLEAKKNKQAIEDAQNENKTASEASSHTVGHSTLVEALQILISQNDRLIELAEQQLAQPKQVVTVETVEKKTTFAVPVEDLDMDVEIKTASRDEKNNSTWNILLSTGAMVTGYDSLPDEVLKYGLDTDRVKPEQLSKETLKRLNGSGNAKAIKGSDVSFSIPDFDDLDIGVDIQQ